MAVDLVDNDEVRQVMKERLSRNFWRFEFTCRCGCGWDTVDCRLLEGLQRFRDIVGVAVTVNSGCRCAAHNLKVGGSPTSQHLLGKAADILVEGYSPAHVAGIAGAVEEFRHGGIGMYDNFVHLDVRPGAVRWDNRRGTT